MPWTDSESRERRRPPDPDSLLKRGRERFKGALPPGSGLPSSINFVAVVLLAAITAFYAFTFRVDPDELGVVMRFGKPDRQELPGLHFRLPYPIEEVHLPKVTRQNIVEIGMRSGAETRNAAGVRTSVREESLMLAGDENIVDVNFVVFWRIQNAMDYLFNIANPETTIKGVAESAMRDVVGRSEIRPLLTGARQQTEQEVKQLMQEVLDSYGAGVRVDQVQLQKVDPPTQVIDAFRDVQAAATDRERLQNEATTYANRVVPEARGDAERILQGALAYREQSVAEATGQSARFLKIHEEYKKAPDVTRTRMYIETMERLFTGADKIIIDGKHARSVVPFLSLEPQQKKRD